MGSFILRLQRLRLTLLHIVVSITLISQQLRRLLMPKQSLLKLLQRHERRQRHVRCRRSNIMSDTPFDLSTYSQVPISAITTDVNGNLVTGVPTVFSTPDSTVVTLQEQSDGTTVATRVTNDASSVVITGTVTNADGTTASCTLTLSLSATTPVVSGVTSVELVPGTPS